MVSIFGGLGSSKSISETSLVVERSGPVRFTSDPSTAALYSAASSIAPTSADIAAGNLDMKLTESSKRNYSQSYAIVVSKLIYGNLNL
jgi:hypothetical protein